MTREIDLSMLFAGALAENKKAHKGIDKIYNSKKDELRAIIQENKEWKELILVRDGCINRQLYILKIMAILNIPDKKIHNALADLIKNLYKSTYDFLMSKKKLVLIDYRKNILKKNGYLNQYELTENCLMAIVIAVWEEIEIDIDDEYYNHTSGILELISMKLLKPSNVKANWSDVGDEVDNKLLKQISSNLKTNYLKRNSVYINKIASKKTFASEKVPMISVSDNLLDYSDKFLLALDFTYSMENIDFNRLTADVKLTDKDIDNIVANYLWLNEISSAEKVNYKELHRYVYVAMKDICLIRKYNNARDLFIKNLDFNSYDTLKDKIKENEELKNKVQELQEENEKLKNECLLLDKKNVNLINEINKTSNYKKELVELREYIFNLSEYEEVLNDKELFEIKDIDAVCFGGQPKWIAKMKDMVNWRFISPDSLNFDVNLIKNSDYVFINTSFISHSMYYKIMANLNENNKLKYINNTNIKRCLKEIS